MDCYGDPEVIGKIGTDIQDCKCGWLVVRALEVASEEQKDKLKVQAMSLLYKVMSSVCTLLEQSFFKCQKGFLSIHSVTLEYKKWALSLMFTLKLLVI